jgi:hypothetical protein
MKAIVGRARVARFASLVVAAAAVAACDAGKGTMIVTGSVLQPSSAIAFGSTSTVAQIQPSFLVHQSVLTFGCPLVQPFTTSFQIVIVQPRFDVTLNQVTLQFIDGTNLGGTPIPFPQPNLTRMFGHTLVRAGTTRAFPFLQAFGCFPTTPKRMTAQIVLADPSGATQATSVAADIQ